MLSIFFVFAALCFIFKKNASNSPIEWKNLSMINVTQIPPGVITRRNYHKRLLVSRFYSTTASGRQQSGYFFWAGAGRIIIRQGLKSGMMARASRSGALRTSLFTSKTIVGASSGV